MGLYHQIRERRILPAVGVYIGACWVLVEILDRLTERYYLSPYLTDIVFWGLYSLVPAVILIAWTHGRPGRDRATTAEKVGVPINVVASLVLLVSLFGNRDLGATAELVTIDNELGQQEQLYIPKDSYRRRVAVFFFNNTSGDPGRDWLQYGVTELLSHDLQQSPFMIVTTPWENPAHGLFAAMKQAGYENGTGAPLSLMRKIADTANRPYFVEGDVGMDSGEPTLHVRLWDTETLVLLGEYQGTGADLMTLVDRASSELRDALDVPPGKRGQAEDLPLASTFGESEEALKQFILGQNAVLIENDWEKSNRYYDAAIAADSEFVLAWVYKGLNQWNQGDSAFAQQSLAKAKTLDYRLPHHDQAMLKGVSYRISGDQDKLERFLRLQIQVQGDAADYRSLARFLMLTGLLDESKENFRQAMRLDSSDFGSYLELAKLERASGDLPSAIEYARAYADARPGDLAGKLLMGDLLLQAGQAVDAVEQYSQAQLLEDPPVISTLRLVLLAIRQGEWSEARELIGEARSVSATPLNASNVLGVEVLLELRLGRVQRAIELTEQQFEFNRQVLAPVEQVFNYYVPLAQYNIMLGRLEEADVMLQSASEAIQPPLNRFLAFSEAVLRARQFEFDAAEKALQSGIEAVEQFRAEFLAAQISLATAEIARSKSEHLKAARMFEETVEKSLGSPLEREIYNQMPILLGASAQMYVKAGDLEDAQRVMDHGFDSDSAEPSLWVARAMLQNASGDRRMALASINYALAIWSGADPDYGEYIEALALRDAWSQ